MRKVLKAVKLTGIAVTASFAVLGAVYFLETKPVSADANQYNVVVEDYVAPSTDAVVEIPSVVASVEAVETADEAEKAIEIATDQAEEESESAEEESEIAQEESEEAEQIAVVEEEAPAPVVEEAAPAPVVEEATPAPIVEEVAPAPVVEEVASAPVVEEAAPAPVVEEAAPAQAVVSTLTSISYNGTSYNTVEEAKASINVATLTDAEAHAQAVANKTTYASEAKALVDQINAYRAANGLPALAYNDNLETAAMHRAAESAYSDWNMTAMENGVKRHIRPNFEKASTIADYYGISGNFGENYARYFVTPEETLEGWQNSSAHNALLLSSDYSQIGIGIAPASGGYGDFYWIAIFN